MWILRSYRWRRRLAFTAITLAVAAPLIYMGVHYSNPGDPGNATGPFVDDFDYSQPKNAPFTPAKQRAVRKVLKEFIGTAVVRNNVAKSWDIAGPDLKAGVSRRQWNRGALPVVPYPAAPKGWGEWSYVQYSYVDTIGLEVFLFAKPGSGFQALTADVEVVKGKNGRWLVNYWMPKKFHGPAAVAPKTREGIRWDLGSKARAKAKTLKKKHEAKQAQRTAAPAIPEPSSGKWWIFPVSLLALVVLLPILIVSVVWYRNRKAERDYLRSLG